MPNSNNLRLTAMVEKGRKEARVVAKRLGNGQQCEWQLVETFFFGLHLEKLEALAKIC